MAPEGLSEWATIYVPNVMETEHMLSSDRLGLRTSLKLRFAHATTAAIGGGNTSSFEGLSPNKHQEPPNS